MYNEVLKFSTIDTDGVEYCTACVACKLDARGTCAGTRISLTNDHKKQTVKISKLVGAKYIKELFAERDETWTEPGFVKWLAENGYKHDPKACRETVTGGNEDAK